jgi:Ca2+-binding RTX toxin-like protein
MLRKIDFNNSNFVFFREGVGAIESNGNYNEISSLGFLGKYQFGEMLLVDLGYYSFEGDNTRSQNTWEGQWKHGLTSEWDFLDSPSIQDQSFNEAMQLRWNWIDRRGLDRYVGSSINSITITEAGLLAAAWLNPLGLVNYLQSGGVNDYTEPNDSISNRLSRFSSGFDIPFVDASSFPYPLLQSIHEQLFQCHQSFNSAKTVQSPLILDLDGDGIETTTVNGGAYFDHDKNGFAEQTSWASSDDGLLVLDRNGDGIINDGKELFGNKTPLKNNTLASNGFQALAEWDDNKDGKIDINDSVWSNLKVWQDYDGDGFSGSDELWNLSDLGITSINTGYTTSSLVDPNGNEHRQVGSFTRSDGTMGTATDVWFKADKMYTIANEWLDVPEDIGSLPDLQGYGNVYDLHQAMVRDTSGQLKSLVEQYMAATDPNVRNTLMEQILFKWTGSEGIDPNSRGPNINARVLGVLERFFGEGFLGVSGSTPNPNAGNMLNQCYQGIFEMFYAGLIAQTNIKDLYELVTYTWDEGTQSLRGNLSGVITELQNRIAVDPVLGKTALGEFTRSLCGFGAENIVDYEGFRNTFVGYNEELGWIIDSGGKNIIMGTTLNDSLSGTGKHDAIAGGEGNDTLSSGVGDDVLYGQGGSDTLYGAGGNDLLYGGLGNDTLNGDWYQVLGSEGADTIDGGPGNDTLKGGLRNDTYLFGRGYGVDTISDYDTTSGNMDTLKFVSDVSRSDVEITRNGNTLVFKIKGTTDQLLVPSGIMKGAYSVERVEFGDGIVLTTDEMTTISEEIRGTSGNDTLNGSSITDRIYGEAGNDTVNGDHGSDLLEGGAGSDSLYGGMGSDLLRGGLGSDTLNGDWYQVLGWEGADTLDGGPGNDTLSGGLRNDTYLFGRGYGVDTISDYDTTAGNSDKVKLLDLNPIDLIFVNNSNNLNIQINNSSDLITVQNQNSNSAYKVEVFEAADGRQLLSSNVALLIQEMAGFSSSTGMSWTQLIQNKPEEVQTILSQYWQPPT